MPTFEATLILKVDGVDVPNFPYTRRVTVDGTRALDLPQTNDATYDALTSFATLGVLAFVTLDEAVTVRLAAQTDQGIPLNAGGMLVVIDGALTAGGATNNVKVNNASSGTSQIVGAFGGT